MLRIYEIFMVNIKRFSFRFEVNPAVWKIFVALLPKPSLSQTVIFLHFYYISLQFALSQLKLNESDKVVNKNLWCSQHICFKYLLYIHNFYCPETFLGKLLQSTKKNSQVLMSRKFSCVVLIRVFYLFVTIQVVWG